MHLWAIACFAAIFDVTSHPAAARRPSVPAHLCGNRLKRWDCAARAASVCWRVATLDSGFDSPLTFDSEVEIAARRRGEALNANEAPLGLFDSILLFFFSARHRAV